MKKSVLVFAFLLAVLSAFAQPHIIAHRGYWLTKGSAQNSITAFKKAIKAGTFGVELDVHLTRDGQVLMSHDPHIFGMDIADYTYEDLKRCCLPNGERIPLLEKFLRVAKRHPEMKLFLEIKPLRTPEQETQLVSKSIALVEKFGMQEQVEYISFSKHACNVVKQQRPNEQVAYLTGDLEPEEVASMGWTGIDYNLSVMKQHPDWAERAHKLGLTINIWTPDSQDDLKSAISFHPDFITTNAVPRALEMVKE